MNHATRFWRAYGIIKKENSQAKHLMSVQCSGCGEFNKSTNSFCIKCKAVLKYDEFIKTLDKEKQLSQKHEEEMKTMYERMDRMDRILKLIYANPMLARAKRTALERLANTK